MRGLLLTVAAALVAACVTINPARAQSRPLMTAVYFDPPAQAGVTPAQAAARIVRAGAVAERLTVYWSRVAPETRPARWNAADPGDTHYDWAQVDSLVRAASAKRLRVLITVMAAPSWAQTGDPKPFPNSNLPSPTEFAKFTTAIAKRYSGSFRGLPRVRWWQAWNEPNISLYLVPQLQGGKPVAPAWYRKMLNAFAAAVRGVHRDNVVVAGGMAPFRDLTGSVVAQDPDWGPLSFMRSLLCMSRSLKRTCKTRVAFDVWSQHPYTSGSPLHRANLPNDVSLGDLPKVVQLLRAAKRAGQIASNGQPRLWVTEFSWDSSPPDPKAVPMALLSRWTAEALWRMWRNQVELVTWLMIRDQALNEGLLQSGLWFRGATVADDKPKPMLEAFRFPVVGFVRNGAVAVWGRTPAGRRGRVLVQQSFAGGWRNLGTLATDANGIFQRSYKAPRSGSIRARLVTRGETSIPFSLTPVPDQFFNPFGSETKINPNRKAKVRAARARR